MSTSLSFSAQKVQHALHDRGVSFPVTELPASTCTAQDAADAIDCTVPQMAKSLIFRGASSGDLILAIASGSNRVDTDKLAVLASEPIARRCRLQAAGLRVAGGDGQHGGRYQAVSWVSKPGSVSRMHRIGKAVLQGHETIEAVQFDDDPAPDFVDVYPEELPY